MPAWLIVRFNIHMLQLNGYNSGEHLLWLKQNVRKQWILLFLSIISILNITLSSFLLDVVSLLILWIIYVVYAAMKRIYSKKPLVFTARVKRLIFTIVVLDLIILIGSFLYLGHGHFRSLIFLTISLQWVIVVIANLINSIIERQIRNNYIKGASGVLTSIPNLKIVGITGSYGKTSVKFYLKTILSTTYNVLATPQSYNTPMGIVKTINSQLTPMHDIFICEMGARKVGEIREICDFVHPHYGIITAIGQSHLATFKSVSNIQKTKFELADSVLNRGEVVLNANNNLILEQVKNRQDAGIIDNCIFYGSKGKNLKNCNFTYEISSVSTNGTKFTIFENGINHTLDTHLVGSHNIENICGAIAMARNLGCSWEDITIGVRRISAVAHRMELKNHGNVTIIDDAFNSNPAGSKAALETLKMFDGCKILITPGMVELGGEEESLNKKFGEYAALSCDYAILVGETHTRPIKKGLLKGGFDNEKIYVFNSFDEAIQFAYKIDSINKHKFILLENDLPDNYYSIV